MNDPQPGKTKSLPRVYGVCRPGCCFIFDNVFRKLFQNPDRILKPYIKPGWIVLDVGPGIGYFTIPLAKLVGSRGKVIAADLQQQMLDGIQHRAIKAGMQERIKLHLTKPDSICINDSIDACLAFWMIHEVPDRNHFFNEISSKLKPGGLMLIAEPTMHVSQEDFNKTLEIAKSAGLSVVERPRIFLSFSALIKK